MRIFHLTTPEVWAAARESGSWTTSTRGRSLEQEGFVHCSEAHQVEGVRAFWFADLEGRAVAVEVKRRGEIDGVEQLTRYLELLNRDPALRPVRGIFAAQEIKPQARVLATDRGIGCAVLDYDALRGIEDDKLRLF